MVLWNKYCYWQYQNILPEVEDHEDEAVDPLLGEAGLVLELPAVLGAVQGGELEAVVGENAGERVKKGPFKQKKVWSWYIWSFWTNMIKNKATDKFIK